MAVKRKKMMKKTRRRIEKRRRRKKSRVRSNILLRSAIRGTVLV